MSCILFISEYVENEIFSFRKENMKTLFQYLKSNPQPEEWLPVMINISIKILTNALKGIQDKGIITVVIVNESEIDITGSDRKMVVNKNIEEIYRETVTDLIETYKLENLNSYVNVLSWRYDNDTMTHGLIMQVVEKYVEGTVPMDIDILHILGADGLLSIGAFQDPISLGEDYYNKESTRRALPPWDVFINLRNEKEKTATTMEIASRYLSRFFIYYWKYRLAFRGKQVMEKYKYLMIDSISPIHPITFLSATPYFSRKQTSNRV